MRVPDGSRRKAALHHLLVSALNIERTTARVRKGCRELRARYSIRRCRYCFPMRMENRSLRRKFGGLKSSDFWAQHWNAGILDKVVAAYAPGAVYLPPHHEAIHGRDAIREYQRQ